MIANLTQLVDAKIHVSLDIEVCIDRFLQESNR